MTRVTALLPMKGNSVRVPNKNIRSIAGSPLFTYVLNTLIQARWIDEIIINTDSEQIADIARKTNSEIRIHWREESLLGDDTPMNNIIGSDLSIAKNDHILQTHSTNPLLSLSTLDSAYETYLKNLSEYDSLFSVNKFQSRFFDSEFNPINHNPEILLKTQDLPPLFEENSLFYFFSKNSFDMKKTRIGKKPYLFSTPKIESVDIDTEEDFSFAEKLLELAKGKAK